MGANRLHLARLLGGSVCVAEDYVASTLVSLGTKTVEITTTTASKKKSIMAVRSSQPFIIMAPAQPVIQSWCQKVVGGHLPLLEELIIFPEGKFTHHQLANNHVAGSTLPDGRYPTAAFNSIHPRTLPPHLAA